MIYKIGDKVRVIAQRHGHSYRIGEIYEITHVIEDRLSYFVPMVYARYDSGDSYILDHQSTYVKDDEIELAMSRKEVHMNNCKWGVKYERNTDPTEFFKSKKEAEKRITDLLDDPSVRKSEIYLFEVGAIYRVDRPVNFKLVKE